MYPAFPVPGISYDARWSGALAKYGSLRLTAGSPPQSFTEPLGIDEVKDYLKLPFRNPVDAMEDLTLGALITAARETAEISQGRDLVIKQWDLALDYWPGYAIELRSPLVSVDLVRYRSFDGSYSTLVEDTDYIVDTIKQPGAILPAFNRTWPAFTPWPSSAILVRFRSGLSANDPFWADAGPRVKVGMKKLVLEWFTNRLPTGSRVEELPFAITACLSYRAVTKPR